MAVPGVSGFMIPIHLMSATSVPVPYLQIGSKQYPATNRYNQYILSSANPPAFSTSQAPDPQQHGASKSDKLYSKGCAIPYIFRAARL